MSHITKSCHIDYVLCYAMLYLLDFHIEKGKKCAKFSKNQRCALVDVLKRLYSSNEFSPTHLLGAIITNEIDIVRRIQTEQVVDTTNKNECQFWPIIF